MSPKYYTVLHCFQHWLPLQLPALVSPTSQNQCWTFSFARLCDCIYIMPIDCQWMQVLLWLRCEWESISQMSTQLTLFVLAWGKMSSTSESSPPLVSIISANKAHKALPCNPPKEASSMKQGSHSSYHMHNYLTSGGRGRILESVYCLWLLPVSGLGFSW